MIRITIWSGGTGSNRGDQAIFSAIVEALKSAIPNLEIRILSINPFFSSKDNAVIPVRGIWDTLVTLWKTDLLLWGGGCLLQDQSSILYIPWQLSRVVLAKLFGKPVMCYAQGIGPIRTWLGRLLSRIVVNQIDLITVRDKESKKILKEVGVKRPPICVTADPAVALKPVGQKQVDTLLSKLDIVEGDRPLIGISVRRWFHYHFTTLPVKFNVKHDRWPEGARNKFEDFKKMIAKAADFMIKKWNARVIFIPMVLGVGEEDDRISKEIIELMANKRDAVLFDLDCSPRELMGVIGRMELFIGVRMHSTILATAMNVPSIALYYQPKGKSYFGMIDQEQFAINIHDLNFNHLIGKTELIWSIKDQVKSELKPKIKNLQKSALSNVIFVKKLLRY